MLSIYNRETATIAACLGKGGNMDIGSKLVEELQVENVFTIPIFGGIPISETVVVTWIIMGVTVLLSVFLTHGFRVENPSKRQEFMEAAVTGLQNVVRSFMDEKGEAYVEYLTSIMLFLGIANLIGILGFKPPTKDLNMTACLAIMSIILVQAAGIRQKGVKGWAKSFAKPMAFIAPLNVLEIVIKPLSLCMRLFGNVLGSFVIMELIELVVPFFVPVVLSMYFDVFDGLIQAYVFVFLTGLYIGESTED